MTIETLKGRWLRSTMYAGIAVSMAMTASSAAFAQDDDEEVEEFFITGSRIARSDFTSENPVTVVTGEQLLNSGFQTISEALRQQSAVTSGGFSQSSVLNGGGATSVDLRNLGGDRVLVLINGKRVATFADTLQNEAKDLSFIPIAMVQRVEILRDGASSNYGADAVTGVINVILRDDFEGLRLSAQQGVATKEWDGESTQLSAVLGGSFDRGNIVVGMEYRFSDEIMQRDREWAFPAISGLGSTFTNGSFYSSGGLLRISGYGVTNDFCTEPTQFGGNEIDDISTSLTCPSSRVPADRGDHARYDYGYNQYLWNNFQVFNASAYGNYEIADWISFYVEAQISKRESHVQLDGNPGAVAAPGFADNPFMTRDLANPLVEPFPGGGTFYIRPATTVGLRHLRADSNMFRSVVGLKGDFDLLDRNWSWDLAHVWTKVDTQIDRTGIWNAVRLAEIASVTACAANPLCAQALIDSGKVPGSLATDGTGGALDLIRPGNWSDQEIAYFDQGAFTISAFETQGVIGVLTGDIADLPAGSLGVAIGFETREDSGMAKPDSVTVAGESIENRVFDTEGKFDSTEFFAEMNIPIVSDLPGAQELSLNLQGRWFDFSNFGDDTVWKIGLNYQPVEDVRIRFNMGTSFRAPTVVDLFNGGTDSFDHFTDVCNNWDTVYAPASNEYLNCQADGLPLGFVQIASQYRVLRGGNPNLDPETAETLSVGAIFTPRWVPNLAISVDYWQIELENFIGLSQTSDSIVDACYSGPTLLAAPECARFNRSAGDFQVINLVNRQENISGATIETSGVDWSVNYFFDLFDGTLTISHNATYLLDYNLGSGVGEADADNGSTVTLRGDVTTRFDRNDYGIQWRLRFIGELDEPDFNGANVFGFDKVEPHVEHDLHFFYDLNNYQFMLGLNNVFDEEPPYMFYSGGNADYATYGSATVGRYLFARVTADF